MTKVAKEDSIQLTKAELEKLKLISDIKANESRLMWYNLPNVIPTILTIMLTVIATAIGILNGFFDNKTTLLKITEAKLIANTDSLNSQKVQLKNELLILDAKKYQLQIASKRLRDTLRVYKQREDSIKKAFHINKRHEQTRKELKLKVNAFLSKFFVFIAKWDKESRDIMLPPAKIPKKEQYNYIVSKTDSLFTANRFILNRDYMPDAVSYYNQILNFLPDQKKSINTNPLSWGTNLFSVTDAYHLIFTLNAKL